jgi:hypothetical protein
MGFSKDGGSAAIHDAEFRTADESCVNGLSSIASKVPSYTAEYQDNVRVWVWIVVIYSSAWRLRPKFLPPPGIGVEHPTIFLN